MNDREAAFRILNRIEKDKAYSNLLLDSYLKNNSDSIYSGSFVTALVYGVTERLITLDYILSCFLKQPLKKLRSEVLTSLRLGVYQIKFMDAVPVSAAVNESVKLVKNSGCAYASGLVNSVLRRISENETVYPETNDVYFNLSIRYSCPEALVKQFCDDYSVSDAEGILASSLGRPKLTAKVNTLLTDCDSLIDMLKDEGVDAKKSEELENYILLNRTNTIETSELFKKGCFHIQDISSGKCVKALDAKPGMTVIDVCAAPGGKSFSVAQMMNNEGRVISFDLYKHRTDLINDGAKRLKINIIDARTGDSSVFDSGLEGCADRVLCDVPCSCLGTLSRKPEIKYKDFGFIDKLCDLQYNILVNSSRYLNESGKLVYSTCSLSKRENEGVCERFLRENGNFEALGDFVTLMPHINGSDGFFIAVFGRK